MLKNHLRWATAAWWVRGSEQRLRFPGPGSAPFPVTRSASEIPCPLAQHTSQNSRGAWEGRACPCFLLLVGRVSSTADGKAEPAGTSAGPSVCRGGGWGFFPTGTSPHLLVEAWET